jgi:hypothetical protein
MTLLLKARGDSCYIAIKIKGKALPVPDLGDSLDREMPRLPHFSRQLAHRWR